MQIITVELTNPHTFKLIKDLEAAQLLKIKPQAKAKAKKLTKKQQQIVSDLKDALHEVDLY